jgi:hypothetical protein
MNAPLQVPNVREGSTPATWTPQNQPAGRRLVAANRNARLPQPETKAEPTLSLLGKHGVSPPRPATLIASAWAAACHLPTEPCSWPSKGSARNRPPTTARPNWRSRPITGLSRFRRMVGFPGQTAPPHRRRRSRASAAVFAAQSWPKRRNRTRFCAFDFPSGATLLVANVSSDRLADPHQQFRSGGHGRSGSVGGRGGPCDPVPTLAEIDTGLV